MKKKTVKADFTMSYADLMQLGDKAVALITRDASELATYGVTTVVKNFIANKTKALKDFPTDGELLGDVEDATEEKDKAAEKVKVDIRSVMVRVKNTFGESSAKYRKFETKGMDDMTDSDLLKCAKRVVRVATLYLSKLSAKGLTLAKITALKNKTILFDKKIDDKEEAVRDRDIATEDRMELGNLLYNKIVEVFDYGKDYWESRDEAKYNDYIIYDTPEHLFPRDGSVGDGATENVLHHSLPPAKLLLFKNLGDFAIMFCLAADATTACSAGVIIPPHSEEEHPVSDLGDINVNTFLNVTNQGGGASSWEVRAV